MRAVIQRVRSAAVTVDDETVGRIDVGLLVYVGVATTDGPADADFLAEKVAHLRIFPDEQGKMNLSVQDVRGGVLAVPNFTLLADARKGRRPAFVKAAPPEQAEPLHEAFISGLRARDCQVSRGVFGAHMLVDSVADGPVNIVLDSPPPT
jgi:D-aminoacyl-tRNA deacylase